VAESLSSRIIEAHRRQALQQCVRRGQVGEAICLGQRGKLIQRHSSGNAQIADGHGSPQCGEMRATTKSIANILHERPDVSPFAARDAQTTTLACVIEKLQIVNRHLAWRTLDLNSLPGQLVQRFSVALECRVHRWNLGNRTAKGNQRRLQRRPIERRLAAANDDAFSITGIGGDTEQDIGFVGLVGIEQDRPRTSSPRRNTAATTRSQAGPAFPYARPWLRKTDAAHLAARRWRSFRLACRAAARRQRAPHALCSVARHEVQRSVSGSVLSEIATAS
jgi:hypothetical protein